VSPGRITPSSSWIRAGVFPNFTDPNQATTLEVIEYDQQSGSARPFKVTFKDGRWTIPSHNDYRGRRQGPSGPHRRRRY